jgi:hypothetical protein
MNNLMLKTMISQVIEEYGDDRFIEGDCLNLAVALHNILEDLEIESHVIKIMRSVTMEDEEESYDEKLSHVALYFDEKQEELSSLSIDKLTFDIHGDRASLKWGDHWNQVQRENGDLTEEFWDEIVVENDINDFCEFSETEYGNIKENKLVNNIELRDSIQNLILNSKLIKKYKQSKNIELEYSSTF